MSIEYRVPIDVKIKTNLKNNTDTIKLKRYDLIATFNTFYFKKHLKNAICLIVKKIASLMS